MIRFLKSIGFLAINVLLIWHVFAIAISPSAMPPASPLLADASNVARPYNQALFLNHGYHYFAPNPGSSSLLEFETTTGNDVPQLERIPDPDSYFPRLRYHRFFMLAENVWSFGGDAQKEFIEAYARHFAKKMNSDSISVTTVSHEPAAMRRIMAGGDLKHPTSYFRDPLAEFQFSEEGSTIRKSFIGLSETEVDIQLLPTPPLPGDLNSDQANTSDPNSNSGVRQPASATPMQIRKPSVLPPISMDP
ncbi:MAG: hypothetical protein ABJZ55_21410 [Fuerstiella sp.]